MTKCAVRRLSFNRRPLSGIGLSLYRRLHTLLRKSYFLCDQMRMTACPSLPGRRRPPRLAAKG